MNNFIDSILSYLGYTSFYTWFFKEGIWALLLVIFVLISWYLFHRLARPRISSLSVRLKNRDETRDIGIFMSLMDTKGFDTIVLVFFLLLMSVGLLSIIGVNVSPISSDFQEIFNVIIYLNDEFYYDIALFLNQLDADYKVGIRNEYSDLFYNIQFTINKSNILENGYKQINQILNKE